jgi:hypothetical protein
MPLLHTGIVIVVDGGAAASGGLQAAINLFIFCARFAQVCDERVAYSSPL